LLSLSGDSQNPEVVVWPAGHPRSSAVVAATAFEY
jgi:hypothetical protein